jgi:hypothetical protein
LGILVLAILTGAARIYSLCPSANAQGSSEPTVRAAMSISGYVSSIDIQIAKCRSLPKAASQRTDLFRPLREKYPDDMRLIEEWR